MERRLTPNARKAASCEAPAEVGLASRVISASAAKWAQRETVSRTAVRVSGLARLGVPPPKKTELILRSRGERGPAPCGVKGHLQTHCSGGILLPCPRGHPLPARTSPSSYFNGPLL